MSIAATSISLVTSAAVLALILAVAAIWLVLTNPAGMADAMTQGAVTPFIRELASAILGAIQGILGYL